MKVSVLSNGLGIYPSRGFLLPILRFRSELESEGVEISISKTDTNLDFDCDCLIIEDNVFTRRYPIEETVSRIKALADRVNRILWFDTDDSTGTITQEVIPEVDGYYKKQLLRDRKKYCDPQWRSRVYTDYYYNNYNIETAEVNNDPQVKSEFNLEKLGVFWNLGFESYLPFVNNMVKNGVFKIIPDRCVEKAPWETVMSAPGIWASANKTRKVPISGRFSTSHGDAAIKLHRKLMLEKLSGRLGTQKLNTVKYWRELRNTKVLLSPYGWGEVCHRDFEGFLSGCLLIKPRMDYLETWPPLFEDNVTMLAVNWDMSDLEQTVDWALENEDERLEIARKGQQRYRHYIHGQSAAEKFTNKFLSVVRG